jgi:serine/threonine protein phosphatase PrpC
VETQTKLFLLILTTMISTTKHSGLGAIASFGCSVTGPGNLKRGSACQDAWGHRSWRIPSGIANAIAIADGMGSKSESRTGAQAAKSCALKAAKRWTEHPSVGTEWLIRWLEAEWRYSLGTHDPKECCTTCWVIVNAPEMGILVMGLGDGLALLAEENGQLECVFGRNPENFSNETVALGTPHKAGDWKVRLFPDNGRNRTAILATDGIADDLLDEKLITFVSWIRSTGELKNPGKSLRRELQRWPVKGHSDDKTVAAMLWKKTSTNS